MNDRSTTHRILVVDDESHILHVLSLKLGKAGYDVLTAVDGEEGLHLARESKPDLVITDIQMPYMTGIELSREATGKNDTLTVDTYTDADLAGDLATSESTNGWASGHDERDGYTHAYVEWGSKLQTVVALSTGESEYVSASHGARSSGLPLQDLVELINPQRNVLWRLFVDNSAAE